MVTLKWKCNSCSAEFLDPAMRPVAIGADDYEEEPCCPRCSSLNISFTPARTVWSKLLYGVRVTVSCFILAVMAIALTPILWYEFVADILEEGIKRSR